MQCSCCNAPQLPSRSLMAVWRISLLPFSLLLHFLCWWLRNSLALRLECFSCQVCSPSAFFHRLFLPDYFFFSMSCAGKYIGNRPVKLRKSTWQERVDRDALAARQRKFQHVRFPCSVWPAGFSSDESSMLCNNACLFMVLLSYVLSLLVRYDEDSC